MKNLFKWNHNLVYGDKERSEYEMDEEGSLDNLLYRMYMIAHDLDGLSMSNAVKALNTAYYLAVVLYNTPHVEEANGINHLTYRVAKNILSEEHEGGFTDCVSEADVLLVRWMSWVILKMQRNKPRGLDTFLNSYLAGITEGEGERQFDSESFVQCGFSGKFSDMMKELEDVSYDSDLRPNAMFCYDFPDVFWKLEISGLSHEEIECLMRFNRDKGSQLALLDRIHAISEKYPKLLNFDKEDYILLKNNIECGACLPTEKEAVLPSLPNSHDEEIKKYRKQCQAVLDMYLDKINAQKTLLAGVKKKLESNEAVDASNKQIADFNSKLEDRYRKLLKKYEEESRDNKKALADLQELSDKVLEENKKLKEDYDALQEELDFRYGWMENDELSDEEEQKAWEQHEQEQREYEEYDADREPSVVRGIFGYCIDYVSNIDNVQDSHVECIKDMLESLLDNSSDVNNMSDSDRLNLTKKLHSIKKNRKQMEQSRKSEMKAEMKPIASTNNYYGNISQQISTANQVNME